MERKMLLASGALFAAGTGTLGLLLFGTGDGGARTTFRAPAPTPTPLALRGEGSGQATAGTATVRAPSAPMPPRPPRVPPPVPALSPPPVPESPEEARLRALERTFRIGGPSRPGQLASAGGWMRAIALHAGLPRRDGASLAVALAEAVDPVARQNVIFLAVLTLPPEESYPWLRGLAAGDSAGDAEDALLALAFDGDPEARAAFARLAGAPSRAPVHRLLDDHYDHEELGRTGTEAARAVLRSYRAIEVLDREPYFKFTFHDVRHAGWRPHPSRTPELDRELLPEWLARYPGHPGSDDMAIRLGWLATARGAHVEAARWYGRAAALPDQDVVESAVGNLAATCELLLTPEELDALAHEQGLATPNRTLLQYVRLRRLASERNLEVAMAHAAALGRDEPATVLGYAWNHRRSAPEPKGLDSGLARLPADDPLRGVEGAPPFERPEGAPAPALVPGWLRWGIDDARRLEPWPDRLQIHDDTLRRQFRAWEAIAALDLRAAQATGDARADLLYKEAAIFYHDPRVLYPAYASDVDFRRVFWRVTWEKYTPRPASFGDFVRTSYSLLHAIRLLERIEREHPRYAAMDKVLFSQGLAWKNLLRWSCDAAEGGYGGADPEPQRTKIRLATAALERCSALFPRSPLADDAERAASFWRRTRPEAFR